MKKLIAFILFACLICSVFAACTIEQKPFTHALKTGRYISDELYTVGDLEISYFEMELTDGNMMQYVKTDGRGMIKDLATINDRFQTVLCVKLTMCVSGETEQFRFEKAKALNNTTETEYLVSELAASDPETAPKYPGLDSFMMTTVDDDGDGVAEKVHIEINGTEIVAENNDIPYTFTLRDDAGVFGTTGVRELTYFDYQTVELRDYDVVSFMYDGSHETKYRMPVITLSTGEVLTPVLVKADGNNSVDHWLIAFPMPSHNISGTVSQIEVGEAEMMGESQ